MTKKWTMPKMTGNEEQNKFFTGVINAFIICIPLWLMIAWLIWG